MLIAGDEATVARFDVGECPEAIELQFPQPVGFVERLSDARGIVSILGSAIEAV